MKKRQVFIFLFAFAAFVGGVEAQEKQAELQCDESARELRLKIQGAPECLVAFERMDAAPFELPLLPPDDSRGRKNPVLAGGLSLVLPGAGEAYSESYLLAGLFLALEAAGWYGRLAYLKKGDDATSIFERYADEHWSAVKYAEWLNANAKNFTGWNAGLPQISIDPNNTLQPWQRVDWAAMNTVEAALEKFSHRLPYHGDQQYFELIGKYNQFSYGWDDKLPTGDGWSDYDRISPRFQEYAGMRGKANNHYSNASTIMSLIVINHVLSAADAAWAAARFNNNVKLHSRVLMNPLPDGHAELMPTTTISWSF
jgi:hypothetical protein